MTALQPPIAAAAGRSAGRPRRLAGRDDSAGWLPTLGVAAVIAAVVLGGPLLDAAVPLPSLGRVAVGPGARIEASAGWFVAPAEGFPGVVLQKGDAVLGVAVQPGFGGAPSVLVAAVERAIQDDPGVSQVSFRETTGRTVGGLPGTEAGYEAWLTGGGVPIDGQLIAVVAGTANGVYFDAYAPQGDLGRVLDDIERMAQSIEIDG